MDNTEKMVLQALKDKAPSLHRQLSEAGTLRQFVTERADEMNEEIVTLTMEIATPKPEYKNAKTLIERAGVLKMAEIQAKEIVFAEMLEFPQDETSPPSQDETTPLAMAT
jgi:uncharacterized coiled-coil DUF342 family protein